MVATWEQLTGGLPVSSRLGGTVVAADPGDPDKCPVFQLHQVYSDESRQQWVREGCSSAGIGCLDCKQPIIESVLADVDRHCAPMTPHDDCTMIALKYNGHG